MLRIHTLSMRIMLGAGKIVATLHRIAPYLTEIIATAGRTLRSTTGRESHSNLTIACRIVSSADMPGRREGSETRGATETMSSRSGISAQYVSLHSRKYTSDTGRGSFVQLRRGALLHYLIDNIDDLR